MYVREGVSYIGNSRAIAKIGSVLHFLFFCLLIRHAAGRK